MQNSKFDCHRCADHQTNLAYGYPGIGSNCQSFKIENVCYVGNTIRAGGCAFDNAITKIKSI